IPWIERAGPLHDGFELPSPPAAAADAPGHGSADLRRNLYPRVERAVVQIADQALFLLIARPGQVDERTRIGGDDHRYRTRQAQTQGQVVLGRYVLDAGHAGR